MTDLRKPYKYTLPEGRSTTRGAGAEMNRTWVRSPPSPTLFQRRRGMGFAKFQICRIAVSFCGSRKKVSHWVVKIANLENNQIFTSSSHNHEHI